MTKHTPEMNNSNNFKQPEVLRLADALEDDLRADDGTSLGLYSQGIADNAAAELRRLYAEVDRLSYQLAYPDNFMKEPEQEPVARLRVFAGKGWRVGVYSASKKLPYGYHDLYTSPPAQRQRSVKPLTDEAALEMWAAAVRKAAFPPNKSALLHYKESIEAAHGIKENHE